jgi:hypothetical protein
MCARGYKKKKKKKRVREAVLDQTAVY